MFRKILIAAMLATAAGYCFAAIALEQVVTSEVFYKEDRDDSENYTAQNNNYYTGQYQQPVQYQEPYQEQTYEYQARMTRRNGETPGHRPRKISKSAT